MFGSRSLRLVRLLAAVPACWGAAGFAIPALAEDVWSSLATVSASAPLASGRVCYSDGRDIACDVTAPTLASLTAPLSIGLNDLTDVTASVSLGSIWAGSQSGGTGTATVTESTAFGYRALYSNSNGYSNSAFGYRALHQNSSGALNTALGIESLYANTTGAQNTAIGLGAAGGNTIANYNTSVGANALYRNLNGSFNAAIGAGAGFGVLNSEIARSAILGYRAGYALTSSTGNILVGYQAGDNITSGNYNIVIGYDADPFSNTGSNQLNIGNTIYGDLGLKRVGIGVTSPTASLEVAGTSKFSRIVVESSAPYILISDSLGADPDNRQWHLINTSFGTSQTLRIQALSDALSGGGRVVDFVRSGSQIDWAMFGNPTGRALVVDMVSRQVGINVNSPTTTLHVSGTFMVTAADSGCTTDTIGTMRVNPTTKRLQLCLDR